MGQLQTPVAFEGAGIAGDQGQAYQKICRRLTQAAPAPRNDVTPRSESRFPFSTASPLL
jgi:hypothetical protein